MTSATTHMPPANRLRLDRRLAVWLKASGRRSVSDERSVRTTLMGYCR